MTNSINANKKEAISANEPQYRELDKSYISISNLIPRSRYLRASLISLVLGAFPALARDFLYSSFKFPIPTLAALAASSSEDPLSDL